ncbi:MAG: hypothetical protein KAH54_03735 [Candidatus Sabulitectum sp.]|nr:hypothetical protein [Candidatus Sabulitectum sp.]
MHRSTAFRAVITMLALFLFSTGCLEKVPLNVTNGLENYDIQYVYISRGSDAVWGTNHLPGTDVLEPGRVAEVMVQPGVYDLQVMDEDGDTYTLNDIRIGTSGFNWTVTLEDIDSKNANTSSSLTHAGQCPVAITNTLKSGHVNGVWISPSGSDEWGDNHLNGEILYTGDSYTAFVQADTYDIYVQDESSESYTRWSILVERAGYNWNVAPDDIDGDDS